MKKMKKAKKIFVVCVGDDSPKLTAFESEEDALAFGAHEAREFALEYNEGRGTSEGHIDFLSLSTDSDEKAIAEWQELVDDLGDRDDQGIEIVKTFFFAKD